MRLPSWHLLCAYSDFKTGKVSSQAFLEVENGGNRKRILFVPLTAVSHESPRCCDEIRTPARSVSAHLTGAAGAFVLGGDFRSFRC